MEDVRTSLKKYNTSEKLMDIFDNALVKFLMSIVDKFAPKFISIPIDMVADPVYSLLCKDYEKKQRILFEAIIKDDKITQEDLKNEKVIIEFIKLYNVAMHVTNNEKVQFLGNLFRNSVLDDEQNTNKYDEYEEFLDRINMLSYRELQILAYLRKCGDKVPYIVTVKTDVQEETEGLNKYTSTKVDQAEAWKYFKDNCVNKLKLDYDIIISILVGAERSGFCFHWDELYPGGSNKVFYTTTYFERFINKINN